MNDELLQRCFDGDLNDAEMEQLFSRMGNDAGLRKDFRSLMSLRNDLQMIRDRMEPLRESVRPIPVSGHQFQKPDRPSLRSHFNKKISVSIPVLTMVSILILFGTYSITRSMTERKQDMQYVYFGEMPAYVVQSSNDVVNIN